jgi:hypothetical protein
VTISSLSMALNLDNNFKVSARKQHELPGNQRVLSQRIRHKQHPKARPNSRPSHTHYQSADRQGRRHVKRNRVIHYRRQRATNFAAKTTTTTTKEPRSYKTEDSTWIRDFSYASGNNATIGTYKVPLVQNLKRPPPTQQRVLPSKEQRVLDLLASRHNRPSTEGLAVSILTSTPEANMRVNTHDITNHSHQPTERRLNWEDERVSLPGLNLKIGPIGSY